MLTYALLSLCLVSFATCLKQCINFCNKDEHVYDGTAIESVNKPAGFCVLLCQSMDGCEGFNYDSAAATCHLISSAHNLTAAAGLTAWSMKLCAAKCLLSTAGAEYLGQMSTTVNGRTCQRWDSNDPHYSWFKDRIQYQPGDSPENYCRNPFRMDTGALEHTSLWCYTVDPAVRWEECKVIACDEC